MEYTEEELNSLISGQIQDAADYIDEFISPERANALRFYQGEEFGNEQNGRSQVVTRDVRDAVQSVLPGLLKIFHSSNKSVEFIPRQANEIEMAEQATDYVNYILQTDGGFFMKLHACLKDVLLMRNGFLKATWKDNPKIEHFRYENLDDQQLAALTAKGDIEILEVETRNVVTPEGDMSLTDCTVRRKEEDGRVHLECLPPEEVILSRNAKSLEAATLVGHRRLITVGEMLSMGFEMEDFEGEIGSHGEDGAIDFNQEFLARKPEVQGTSDVLKEESQKLLPMCEAWIKMNYSDPDGLPELRHIIAVGNDYNKVLLNEPAVRCPIFSASADPTPHDWTGLSFYDLLKDVQETKSSIMRSLLDSLALSVHPRIAFVEGQVNLDDLLDSDAVGALIRTRAPGSIQSLDLPFSGQAAFPVLEFYERIKEDRTGVSRAAAGLDPESLQSSSASAVRGTMQKSQEKLDLIARVVAEQLMKPLYKHILSLVCEYQPKERIIQLRGQLVPMDPRSWNKDLDVVVNVGLGQGDEERKLQALLAIKQAQEGVFQFAGAQNDLVSLKQYHSTLSRITELAGFKDTQSFFTDPALLPPKPPPPPPPPTPEEMLMQAQMAEIQARVQVEAAKLQLEENKSQTDAAIRVAEMENDVQLKIMDLQGKYQQDMDSSALKGAVEAQKEIIRQQGLLERERMKTQSYGNSN